MNKFFEKIVGYGNHIFTALLRLVNSNQGLLYVNAGLRIIAIIGLEYYFIVYRSVLDEQELFWVRLLLLLFFYYSVVSGLIGLLHPEWFLHPTVKTIQAMFEITIYSIFYYFSHSLQGDIYFLYFLPLFLAVHFLGFVSALWIILFATINLYLVFLFTGSSLATTSYLLEPATFTVFVFRALILICMSFAYAVRRRASLIQELKWNRSQFGDVFHSMDNGVFVVDSSQRLQFVNPLLQERHGTLNSSQSCSEYFQTDSSISWKWNYETGELEWTDTATLETDFTDKDGSNYKVAVNLIPLQGNNDRFDTAIAIVKDLSRQQQLLADLDSKVQEYAKRINTLNSKRILIQQTYYELGKRLADSDDVNSLMQVVVDETRSLLHAECAGLFLLNDEVLFRHAVSGLPKNWLLDEQYEAGEGITGQVILPQQGFKHGKPVRNNHVDQDFLVVQRYLKEYKTQLGSHEVRHLLAVPLNGQYRSFGVLRVVNKLDSKQRLESKGFDDEDQDFLVAIASMVAIALEKSRLLKDANKRYIRAATLNEIGQKITQASDWSELRQVIVDETRAMLPQANKATIYLIDESSGNLVIQASSAVKSIRSGFPPLHNSHGIAGKAIRERSVINVNDTRLEAEYVDRGAPELRSLLVAPLLSSNRSTGILSVDSEHVSAFHQDDQELLSALATQASLAIEKYQLFQQEHEQRIYADTLLEVSQKINSNLNLDKMLPEILDELAKVVPYTSITIQTVRDDRLRVIACRGFKDRSKVLKITFPLNNPKFPNYEVMRNKKPFIQNDIQQTYPHFVKEATKYHSDHIRGWMGIPLIHRGKALGMISLDHNTPSVYTEQMAQLVMTFANQVTIALINARLFYEKTQQLVNLDSLFQASRTITSSIDLDEVLNKIVILANQVSAADHTGVLLLGEKGERLVSYETHEVEVPLYKRAREDGVTTRVINACKPVIYNRVRGNDKIHNPVIIQAEYKSYAGLPIIKGERILGVLFVHSSQSGHFDRQHKIPLLQALCNHAAIAIENALLYKEAARQAEMLARLVQTSNELIQHTNLHGLLEYCVNQAKDIFQVEDSSLYLRNRDRNTIDLVCSSTIPAEIWPRRDIYIDGPGLTAFVARTGKTLNLDKDEYRQHPAWSGNHGKPFEDHLHFLPSGWCHSLLISPLKNNKGENIGVLKLENRMGTKEGKKFSEFEVAMHQTFASHIATAVERAWLYQRLDKDARQEARLALGYELHEIYNLIHGALVVRLEITKEKLARNQLEDVRQEIENMSKASRAVNSLLRWIHYDLRGDDLIEEKGLILTLEHVGGLLKVPMVTKVTGREGMSKQVEYALYKIGVEALTNVAKHAGEQTLATITLTKHGGKFTFEVSDNGIGFDESEVFHSAVSFGFEGMKRWAESIGARLEAKSKLTHGTTVCVYGTISEKEGLHDRKN